MINLTDKINTFPFRIVFLCLLFVGFSCTKWKEKETTKVADLFSLPGTWTCNHSKDSLDEYGLCFRQKDTLEYRFSDKGWVNNISPTVAFDADFRGYLYEKFFDFIFFDKKLRRQYRDTVVVKNIIPADGKTKGLFPCKDCNVLTYLKFLRTEYIMPYKLDDTIYENLLTYDFIENKSNSYFKSIFTPKVDGNLPGCQFSGINHDYILQIKLRSNRSDEKIKTLLESIQCLHLTH